MHIRRNIFVYNDLKFACYTGMETDLIFNKQVELPEFAAFPLLETDAGRALIRDYYKRQILWAKNKNIGIVLESVTWVANPERAQKLGYKPSELPLINADAIDLMQQARDAYGDVPTLLSANVGPRHDAYSVESSMSVEDAAAYHALQIGAISKTAADFITAYTITDVSEAIGMVLAAKSCDMPIVVSFTVETDGKLPTGVEVKQAIVAVDAATGGYALYYMLNCAHPDHFEPILDDVMPLGRLKGLVVNASRCSHAELDEATTLDDGKPVELGESMRQLSARFAELRVFGGCCGTDMRHLNEMFE